MGRTSDARGRLITVALQLMRERSYGAVSVEAVCQKAGVNKGSFYHFFPAKSELTVAALEAYWQSIRRDLMEPAFATDVAPLERFARFFQRIYEQHKTYHAHTGHVCGCLFGSLGGELSNQDQRIREKIDETLGCFIQFFEGALREAAANGTVDIADPHLAARAMVAFMEGMLLQAKVSNDPEVFRELTPQMLAMFPARLAGSTGGPTDEDSARAGAWGTTSGSATAPNLDILD